VKKKKGCDGPDTVLPLHARTLEVLSVQIVSFCVMTRCSLGAGCERLGGPCRLHYLFSVKLGVS
jgi:hypothetical protein